MAILNPEPAASIIKLISQSQQKSSSVPVSGFLQNKGQNNSDTGNRIPSYRVKGGNVSRYTISDINVRNNMKILKLLWLNLLVPKPQRRTSFQKKKFVQGRTNSSHFGRPSMASTFLI